MNIDNDEGKKIDELVDKYRQDIMLAAQGINSDNKTYSDSSVNVAALASVNLKNDLRRLLAAQRQALRDEVGKKLGENAHLFKDAQAYVDVHAAISTIFEGKE